jgi:hypothetical protein
LNTRVQVFRRDIKVPANPKRGAKWRQLEANRWRKLKVAGKGHRAFGHKCSNSWMRNEKNINLIGVNANGCVC